ncbi:MAG: exodeoxyribonuclease VII large subunit, partial [Fibrobacter sp.]|nr:exodeoxyribonuclease VII large subunit [Fibrobacter sp.]
MSTDYSFLSPIESEQPYTISEINNTIANILESGNTLVWVEGEISNWKKTSSGHIYFRLKDEYSQIPSVIWRSSVSGLQFEPEDGMAVLVIASVRVYQRGGYYQLDVHRMQPLGAGFQQLAFEQLKERLEKEGLFDPA